MTEILRFSGPLEQAFIEEGYDPIGWVALSGEAADAVAAHELVRRLERGKGDGVFLRRNGRGRSGGGRRRQGEHPRGKSARGDDREPEHAQNCKTPTHRFQRSFTR